MQKKALTCFAIICFCIFKTFLVTGQNFQWAYATGSSTPGDEGKSIAVDDSGNVYTASRFNNDVAIFKNDSMGNLVWWNMFTGHIDATATSPAMTIDNDGNLYVTGYFQNTVDFDPGPAVYNLSNTGGGNAYILKLNAAGNFVWAKMIEGNGAGVLGTDIEFSPNGFIVLAGYHYGIIDFDPGIGISNSINPDGMPDGYTIKLDTAGNFIWGISFGGSSITYAYGLNLDASDNVIISGYFTDTVDFDPGPAVYNIIAGTTPKMFLLKLDSSGSFVWAHSIGNGFSATTCYAVTTDPSNNVYTSGQFSDSCDFDPGAGVFTGISNGNVDCFIVKLDENGIFEWAGTFGGTSLDNTEDLTYSSQGVILVTGKYRIAADLDPGPGIFNMVATGYDDVFMISLDLNGNLIIAKSIGGSDGEFGNTVITDSIGNIYLTGYFADTVDFNPPFQYNLISFGAGDIFTAKFGPLNVGVTDVNGNTNFDIYPNPGNGNFTIEFEDYYSGEYVISNLLGEQIKTSKFENSRFLKFEIEGTAGIYFVNGKTGNKIFNSKFVKY